MLQLFLVKRFERERERQGFVFCIVLCFFV
jgi:hypothetical protein